MHLLDSKVSKNVDVSGLKLWCLPLRWLFCPGLIVPFLCGFDTWSFSSWLTSASWTILTFSGLKLLQDHDGGILHSPLDNGLQTRDVKTYLSHIWHWRRFIASLARIVYLSINWTLKVHPWVLYTLKLLSINSSCVY